jgi:SynChlorMet cassette protein ScmC
VKTLKESQPPLLELSNGLRWCVVSDETLSGHAARLAELLQLKRGWTGDCARLILISLDGESRTCPPISWLRWNGLTRDVPDEGWRLRDRRRVRCWSHAAVPDIICEISETFVFNHDFIPGEPIIMALYDKAVESGCIPLHAGLCELEGKGVLLVGGSGSGKTTCCRRFPQPWRALCDDEVLVIPDAVQGYTGHPFPTWSQLVWGFSGKSWEVGKHTPVSAIFFLEHAETDSMVRLGQGNSAMRLFRSACEVMLRSRWDRDVLDMKTTRNQLFDNACRLARQVPAHVLHTSLHGHFWLEVEKLLACG